MPVTAARHAAFAIVTFAALVVALDPSAALAETPPPRNAPSTPIWTTVPTRIDRAEERRERIDPPAAPAKDPRRPIRGDARVVDGATISVDGNRLRFFGLEPIARDRICDVDGRLRWACGIHARAALGTLVKDRTLRCLTLSVGPDDVAVVDCLTQDRSISERMIEGGWADLDADGRASPALAAARERAEHHGRGIWSRTGAPPPER